MIDTFKREINYLRISVTDRCNLRCVYCMPKEGVSFLGHNDILRYEEMLRVVRIAVQQGITKIRVTGGEPLVRKGVVDFLAALGKVEGLRDISLTTNGILLERFAEPLYEAGIRRINVSLDSLVPEKYRAITRGGDLERVLRGIAKAREAGFDPIKINVVVIRGFNDDEIDDLVRLASENDYQVRFIEYMPIGENMEHDFRYLSNDTIMNRINAAVPLIPVDVAPGGNNGPARIFKMKDLPGELGFISAMSHQFCATCNRLRLTADGRLRACLLADDPEVDLMSPLRSGCTDSRLTELIEWLISMKPEGYHCASNFTARKKCARNMSTIGG
jgi:GTP 3',8-cyclase